MSEHPKPYQVRPHTVGSAYTCPTCQHNHVAGCSYGAIDTLGGQHACPNFVAHVDVAIPRSSVPISPPSPAETPEATDCPTCGHRTDANADLLYHINRVVQWREQSKNDPEAVRIYNAAIDELRSLAPPTETQTATPEPSVAWLIERGTGTSGVHWFCGQGGDVAHDWTSNANNALKFPNRESAQREIDERSGVTGIHSPLGVATEHVFLTQHEFGSPRAAQPATTNGGMQLGIDLPHSHSPVAPETPARFRAVGVPNGLGGISVLEEPTSSTAPGTRTATPSPTTPSAPEPQ